MRSRSDDLIELEKISKYWSNPFVLFIVAILKIRPHSEQNEIQSPFIRRPKIESPNFLTVYRTTVSLEFFYQIVDHTSK